MKPRRTSRIHAGLVGPRALVGTSYLGDTGLRQEYADEIAPRTLAALARILGGVAPTRAGVRRALDLGAGTGASREAVRAHFGPDVNIVSVDRVAAAAGVIVADVRRGIRPRGVEGRFDLLVAAHLLNELTDLDLDARAALVEGWCGELLHPHGLCVIVEPALKITSRALLGVRDRLLTRGLFVVAPCLMAAACPALARERDFCHDSAHWTEATATPKRRSRRVDYSYLVLRPRGFAGAYPSDQALFRVVSEHLQEKGRARLWGCGPAGRHSLVRQDRDATAANAAFEDVKRGDILHVAPTTVAGDGIRIGKDTEVKRS